jgi:hypothetical protein
MCSRPLDAVDAEDRSIVVGTPTDVIFAWSVDSSEIAYHGPEDRIHHSMVFDAADVVPPSPSVSPSRAGAGASIGGVTGSSPSRTPTRSSSRGVQALASRSRSGSSSSSRNSGGGASASTLSPSPLASTSASVSHSHVVNSFVRLSWRPMEDTTPYLEWNVTLSGTGWVGLGIGSRSMSDADMVLMRVVGGVGEVFDGWSRSFVSPTRDSVSHVELMSSWERGGVSEFSLRYVCGHRGSGGLSCWL